MLVTVVEVEPFTSKAAKIWSEEELLEFVGFIAENPEAGTIVPGSGGIRKVRWSRSGTGKRGGVRVIYFFQSPSIPLFLLTIYAKSRRQNLSREELSALKKLAAALRDSYGED